MHLNRMKKRMVCEYSFTAQWTSYFKLEYMVIKLTDSLYSATYSWKILRGTQKWCNYLLGKGINAPCNCPRNKEYSKFIVNLNGHFL